MEVKTLTTDMIMCWRGLNASAYKNAIPVTLTDRSLPYGSPDFQDIDAKPWAVMCCTYFASVLSMQASNANLRLSSLGQTPSSCAARPPGSA